MTELENNPEIQAALQEFETKTKAEEAVQQVETKREEGPSGLTGWLIKKSGGAIKDERQAEYILFGFVLLALAISLFLFFGTSKTASEVKALPGYKIVYPPGAPPRLEPNF